MTPVRFEHIPEVGLYLDQEFSASALSELLAEPDRELSYKALSTTCVHFYLERQNTDVLVTGSGLFALSHPCVKCLENVEIQHELLLDLKLEHPEVVDLEDLLREELFLELPHYPACETECLSSHIGS